MHVFDTDTQHLGSSRDQTVPTRPRSGLYRRMVLLRYRRLRQLCGSTSSHQWHLYVHRIPVGNLCSNYMGIYMAKWLRSNNPLPSAECYSAKQQKRPNSSGQAAAAASSSHEGFTHVPPPGSWVVQECVEALLLIVTHSAPLASGRAAQI